MSEQPETESPSIEDRLMAQFEPEQAEPATQEQQVADESAAPESEAQPEFVEIEYEGKTYQVPPELKDAVLRQSDYTTKTQAAAERQRVLEQKELQIKAAEQEREFHSNVKDDILQIQKIEFQIDQWKQVDVTGMSSEDLWKLSRTIDQLKEKRAEISQAIDGKWRGFQQQKQQLISDAKSKALDHVSKNIKGWSPESAKAIREFAINEGFSAHEVDSIGDPRVIKTLWKAQQFDRLQATNIQGKVKTVPTVKPGSSNPMPQHVKDNFALQKQLKSAKSSGDKAKAIERALMDRF